MNRYKMRRAAGSGQKVRDMFRMRTYFPKSCVNVKRFSHGNFSDTLDIDVKNSHAKYSVILT